MKDPKSAMVTALQMRLSGMTVIANNIDTAIATPSAASAKTGSLDAQKAISDQMKLLYSSDYVYSGVALPEIETVLRDQGITSVSAQTSTTALTASQTSSTSFNGGTQTTGSSSSPSLAGNFIPPPAEKWLDLCDKSPRP